MLLPYPALSALQELKVELREMDGGEQGTWPETTKDFQDGAEDGGPDLQSSPVLFDEYMDGGVSDSEATLADSDLAALLSEMANVPWRDGI